VLSHKITQYPFLGMGYANAAFALADTFAIFASASKLLLSGVFVDPDKGTLSRIPRKRDLDGQFDMENGNDTAAIDVDELLAMASLDMGKEGRMWSFEDRVGRRNV
jgi:hypothetical protein